MPQSETLDPAEAANEEEYRTLMRKFWFAAAISIPVMALSYPGFDPRLARLDADGKRYAANRLGAAWVC